MLSAIALLGLVTPALELLRGSPVDPPTKSRLGGFRPRQMEPSTALETMQSADASLSWALAQWTHSSMASSSPPSTAQAVLKSWWLAKACRPCEAGRKR